MSCVRGGMGSVRGGIGCVRGGMGCVRGGDWGEAGRDAFRNEGCGWDGNGMNLLDSASLDSAPDSA